MGEDGPLAADFGSEPSCLQQFFDFFEGASVRGVEAVPGAPGAKGERERKAESKRRRFEELRFH